MDNLEKLAKYLDENTSDRFSFKVDMFGEQIIATDSLKNKEFLVLDFDKDREDAKNGLIEEVGDRLLNKEPHCHSFEPVIDKEPRMVILTSEDKVTNKPYKGYETLSEAVSGCIERCGSIEIDGGCGSGILECDIYCNDEFLISDDEKFDKINAIASALTGQAIYGNAVILPREGLDSNRGFEYLSVDGEEQILECWLAEDQLMLFANRNREGFKEMHKDYDKNKPKPKFVVKDLNGAEIG